MSTAVTPVPLVFGDYALEDRYRLDKGRVYLTGIQALVRLPMMQRQRDLAAGPQHRRLHLRLSRLAARHVRQRAVARQDATSRQNNIHFQPGLNEDLAATSVWGSQQVNLFPGAKVDGVFSIWYGKGPGVDRSMDVLKHGNAAGTSPHGGVLALAGDDHGCQSSTLPHQSEQVFAAAMIPVVNPATRPGISRLRHSGLRAVALLGLLGRLQGDLRDRRKLGASVVGRSRAHQDRHARPISSCRPAASASAIPIRRSSGEAPARPEDGGGRGLRARQRLRQDR